MLGEEINIFIKKFNKGGGGEGGGGSLGEGGCAFLLLEAIEAIVFINFMVFKDQLIPISEYLYTSCVEQVY